MIVNYEQAILEVNKKNRNDLVKLVEKYKAYDFEKFCKVSQSDPAISHLPENIKKKAKRTGDSAEEIWSAIRACPLYAKDFAKNPTKQTFHEHYAFNLLKENTPYLKEIYNLSVGGKDALYLQNGQVINKQEKSRENTTKSIDFHIVLNVKGIDYNIYVMHKYTKEAGGSQDNQYHDVVDWSKQTIGVKEENIYFIAILDGNYYQIVDQEQGKTKIEHLNDDIRTEHFRAMTLKDVPDFVEELVKDRA